MSLLLIRPTEYLSLKQMISLIVGLGNPGPEYALNRHNIGFMMLDALAEAYGISDFRRKGQALILDANIQQHKIILMKPMTFMNRSGLALSEYASFYKVDPQKILIIHDEMALPFLKVRLKQGGGHGGHNGLKSVDSSIGKDYWRLRIGIEHPGDPRQVTGHVLGNFSPQERERLPYFIEAFVENIRYLIEGSRDTFQNKMAIAFKNSAS